MWAICDTIQANAMLHLSWMFGQPKWNPCCVNTLMSSSGTNYVSQEQEDILTICNAIWINAMLYLFCPFGESKCKLRWVILLISSAVTNYERTRRYWPIWAICDTTRPNAMLKPSCKFGESTYNPCRVIISTSSSGTNYVLNMHEDIDQYNQYIIPPRLILCYIYTASFVNQSEILFSYPANELICYHILNEHEDVDQCGSCAIPFGKCHV